MTGSRENVKVEPRSTFTFYSWAFIHYLRVYVIYTRKFYVRSHWKITPQSQPLTQYNNQKQRINQIETEDMELNNYMCIFPLFGEVRERHSSVYVLV